MTEQRNTRKEQEAQIIAKAWQDEAFKQELLSNPKAALSRELEVQSFPDNFEIQVLEENPHIMYLVLPMKPVTATPGTELSEEQLEAIAAGGIFDIAKSIGSTVWNGISGCSC